jgi:hypothetical protein
MAAARPLGPEPITIASHHAPIASRNFADAAIALMGDARNFKSQISNRPFDPVAQAHLSIHTKVIAIRRSQRNFVRIFHQPKVNRLRAGKEKTEATCWATK